VIWVDAAVPAIDPPHQAGEPHFEATGSINGDLTARMTHNNPLFKVDKGSVFDMIESAICYLE
jgi:hypothetical protein